jgi:hypothetical protein
MDEGRTGNCRSQNDRSNRTVSFPGSPHYPFRMSPAEGFGPPVQIAFCVHDLAIAVDRWATGVGAGPFFVNAHIPVQDVRVFGKPTTFDHSSAYGQWGPVMVELVQDHTTGSSPMTSIGLHHLAYFVEDFGLAAAQLVRQGCPEALFARTASGTSFAFHDARPQLGHMIEIYQRSERLSSFYERVAAAAQGWDGRDPFRSVSDLR